MASTPEPQTPLVPPEETVWQKFSPHHEFPLSVLSSVVLHGLTALAVALCGSFLLPWDAPTTVSDFGFVTLDGGGQGSPVAPNPTDVEAAGLLPPAAPDPDRPDLRVDDSAPRSGPVAPAADLPRTPAPDLERHGPGNGGKGADKGLGNGIGDGVGDGVGNGKGHNKRLDRVRRWAIRFEWATGEDVVKFWGGLGCHLMVDHGNGALLLYPDPAASAPQGRAVTEAEFNRTNQRVWFLVKAGDPNQSCVAVARHLGLTRVPRFIAFLIPTDLEKELLAHELAYRGKDEAFLDRHHVVTTFEVSRRGSGFAVRVLDQKAE